MKINVYSLNGNCKRIVDICEIPEEDVIYLQDIDYDVNFDYILITPTFGFGEVPVAVSKFLKENYKYLKGVVGSGNKNWGERFANAAEIISSEYNIPLLMKIELHGNKKDISDFKKIYLESVENGEI